VSYVPSTREQLTVNAENFAEWLRNRGYRVVRTPSSYWYEASPRVYQAFPYHWVIQPSNDELSDFLRQERAIGLRYSTPLEAPKGCISYHVINNNPAYTMEGLDRRTRQNIRRGLKNCSIEPISFELLAKEGWLLELDTQSRQGRQGNLSEETWIISCQSAGDLPGFEVWGALVDGRLAASLLTFQMDDCCELIYQQCHRDYLRARVNNALAFVVTQTMINRKNVRSIFYTYQSLDAPASVDEFKFRMGYIAKPLRQHVVFHPWLEPIANRSTHNIIKLLRRRYPANYMLAKAEGMFRFNLQGNLPLDRQDWPECLSDRKSMMFETHNIPGGPNEFRAEYISQYSSPENNDQEASTS
jgi:hypothetical protein